MNQDYFDRSANELGVEWLPGFLRTWVAGLTGHEKGRASRAVTNLMKIRDESEYPVIDNVYKVTDMDVVAISISKGKDTQFRYYWLQWLDIDQLDAIQKDYSLSSLAILILATELPERRELSN